MDRPSPSPCRRGFTLVEILIVVLILGMLAGVVIPSFSDATETARYASIKTDLRAIRSQIEVFNAQHKGQNPDLLGAGWVVMTQTTDADQALDADGAFGPYLAKTPVNPFTGASTVVTAASAEDGFLYNPDTGQIWGLMPEDLYNTLVQDDPEIVTYVRPAAEE